MAFDAYFDESIADRNDDLLVIGGLLARRSGWTRLDRNWKIALKRAGIASWHGKEFRHRNSTLFKGVSNTKRKDLVIELADCINTYTDAVIVAEISPSLYLSSTTPRFRSQWGSEYTFCVEFSLVKVGGWLTDEGKLDQVVNIVLADGHRNSTGAIEQMRNDKTSGKSCFNIGDYRLGSMKDSPPLQAADFIAYSSYEHSTNRVRSPKLFERLDLSARRYRRIVCDKQLIEGVMGKIRAYYQGEDYGIMKP